MKPNPKNFCGGNFQDWLEVMLWPSCNGKCPWCIEKEGYHPEARIGSDALVQKIIATRKHNVILLGGEPTLCPDLPKIITALMIGEQRSVYLTTNGSRIELPCLRWLTGINISIHHFDLSRNFQVTGISIEERILRKAISAMETVKVRFNCNLITGEIDTYEKVVAYTQFAKTMGADGVRFAELKNDQKHFVDMYKLFGGRYETNNEPFGLGCIHDVEIEGMPVNLRQMCGLQTPHRTKPVEPQQILKQVLYYDGNIYSGWQKKGLEPMTGEKMLYILELVKKGKLTPRQARDEILQYRRVDSTASETDDSGGEPEDATIDELRKEIKKLKAENRRMASDSTGCCY